MTAIKYRIPRMAAAVMVLGAGCGDGGDGNGNRSDGGLGGSGGGVNASLARAQKAHTEYCRLYAECEPEDFKMYYDDVDECVAQYIDDWEEYVSTYGEDCADATLDELECSNNLGCEVNTSPCNEFSQKVEELCDFGSATGALVTSGGNSASKTRRVATKRTRRRIPR